MQTLKCTSLQIMYYEKKIVLGHNIVLSKEFCENKSLLINNLLHNHPLCEKEFKLLVLYSL